jgi:hypothetical protein
MSNQRPLPSMRDLEDRFRQKFGRELTEAERKFWYLAEEALEDPELHAAKSHHTATGT